MPLSRREFVQASVASVGMVGLNASIVRQLETLVPAAGPRIPFHEFARDAVKLAALRRGVAAMKARKPSDPRSWFFQAAIHGVTDAMVEEALKADPNVANVDQNLFWNRCPHYLDRHMASAEFLIWHRAYLYYFERILRADAGDPALSLPYWDYTDPGQRAIPPEFLAPERDANRMPQNPLYDPRREWAWERGLFQLSDTAVSTKSAFDANDFFGVTSDKGFAGAWDDLVPRSRGLLEASPHNNIHIAVGGVIPRTTSPDGDDTTGLMADVTTAAFDPIFWVHHCNVDRLWAYWECDPNRRWGNAPPKRWFDERPWWFYDVDGSVQNQSRMYYIQRPSLDVRYHGEPADCVPLSSKPRDDKPAVIIAGVLNAPPGIAAANVAAPQVAAAATVPVSVSTTSATTIALTPFRGQLLGRQQSLLQAVQEATTNNPRAVFVEFRGIDYRIPPTVGFDIHLNPAGGAPPGRNSPSYAGVLSLFGIKHVSRLQHSEHSTRLIDVTSVVRSREITGQVNVVLVPFQLLTPPRGQSPISRDAGVRISAVRLVVAEGRVSER